MLLINCKKLHGVVYCCKQKLRSEKKIVSVVVFALLIAKIGLKKQKKS